MIDGLKIRIRGCDQQWLRTHYLLDWKYVGLDKRGRQKYAAKWNKFTFRGDETGCKSMTGSFHTHYYDGANWQDFTFTQFVEVVTSVCLDFGLHSSNLV